MINQKQIINFIKKNKEDFKKKYHIIRIGIFGSFARDEQSEKSDIDLIIEFEKDTQNLFIVKREIKNIFKDKFNLDVDICREKYIKPIFKQTILKEALYV